MRQLLHFIITVLLLTGAAYAWYQVLWTLAPPGHVGPLFGVADTISWELMLKRRAYALEGWVIFGIWVLYQELRQAHK